MATDKDPQYEVLQRQVAQAIDREDRRRRRWIWLFLVLALVPLGIGAYVLVRGADEHAWVKQAAQAAVGEEIQVLRPKLDEVSAVVPEIQQAAARVAEQRQRLDQVEKQQADGLARVEQQVAREIKPALEQLDQARLALPRTEAAVRQIDEQTRQTSAATQELSTRLRQMQGELGALDAKIQKASAPDDAPRLARDMQVGFERLEQRLRALETQPPPRAPEPGRDDWGRISAQLSGLQHTLESHRAELAALASRLERLEGSRGPVVRPDRIDRPAVPDRRSPSDIR